MHVTEAILSRRSIRKYTNQPIPNDLLTNLLNAAMHAPSAYNEQPWQFIIINDRNLLQKIPSFSPHAQMCSDAPVGILICSDKRLEKIQDLWMIDCAAATQNLLLAAHENGIGSVWTNVYARKEIIDGFKNLLNLPNELSPIAFIVLGYPAEQPPREDRFKQDRIHFNVWSK